MRYGWIVGLVWLLAVGLGQGMLFVYWTTPGEAGKAPARWPTDSAIHREPGRPILLVFLHPWCPCSRGSVEELDRLLVHAPERASTYVLLLDLPGLPALCEESDLWRRALTLPAVHVLRDDCGTEARRFAVQTSGHVLLYDAAGALRFSGGITTGRGHQGDNASGRALLARLLGPTPDTARTPVFGCPLFENPEPPAARDRS